MSRIEYIVLDHAQDPREMIVARDGKGRMFAVVSPSFLDNFVHTQRQYPDSTFFGIPIYRYEDLGPDYFRKEGNT